jgi:hypothetical protein
VRLPVALCCLYLFLLPDAAQTQTAGSPKPSKLATENSAESDGRLPVKRVVLYKNGVGYFEHSARVHGNQDLTIDFTTASSTTC